MEKVYLWREVVKLLKINTSILARVIKDNNIQRIYDGSIVKISRSEYLKLLKALTFVNVKYNNKEYWVKNKNLKEL